MRATTKAAARSRSAPFYERAIDAVADWMRMMRRPVTPAEIAEAAGRKVRRRDRAVEECIARLVALGYAAPVDAGDTDDPARTMLFRYAQPKPARRPEPMVDYRPAKSPRRRLSGPERRRRERERAALARDARMANVYLIVNGAGAALQKIVCSSENKLMTYVALLNERSRETAPTVRSVALRDALETANPMERPYWLAHNDSRHGGFLHAVAWNFASDDARYAAQFLRATKM
jgi:hypothetical protein